MKKIYTLAITCTMAIFLFDGCGSLIGKKPKKPSITSQARHKSTMKPYTVLGKSYEPTFINQGEIMTGISSWYGPTFHGKYTSNGEVYDMHDMTAAHKTWPMDTIVRVDNLDNGKSVVVRITDRGPFVDGRIIDCSYAAGKAIGLDKSGIANVKITAVSFKSVLQDKSQSAKNITVNTPATTYNSKITQGGFGIQVGAFASEESALRAKTQYSKLDSSRLVETKNSLGSGGAMIYRVFIVGFSSETEAKDFIFKNNLETNIIVRS